MENHVDDFVKDPKKALFRLSYPTIIAMVVQTMYNIVDTAYIGRLGAEAIAALTFSFPFFFVLMALNAGIGSGINSLIARYLGAKDKDNAENTAMHGIYLSVIISFFVLIIGIFTLKPLFILFGAKGNVLNLSLSYMTIILYGVFIMFPTFILNSIFSAQGDTKTPMKIQITGLLANAILDPIFIYTLKYGVAGAAIATNISLLFSLVMSIYFIKTKSYLHVARSSFKFSRYIIRKIFSIGAPASLMIMIISLYVIFLNRLMAHFGTEYIAAFGIAMRIESVAMLPIIGFSISLLTLVGMFFGAKRFDLVKNISWYSVKVTVLFTSAIGLLVFLFPTYIIRIFTNDKTLIDIGSAYLKIDVFTFPLMAITMIISRILQGLGYGMPGLIINLMRVFLVAIPLAYVFVYLFDYNYLFVAFAMVLGGISSSILGIIWLKLRFLKLHINHSPDN